VDASFRGTSQSGGRVFFQTTESLVAGDTDTRVDVYERSGTTTTLLSTGPAGGNGLFDATFDGNSADGTRVFFHTREPLTVDDSDTQSDVYQRSGAVTTRVSTGPSGGNSAHDAAYAGNSFDGSRVFLETREPLTGTDTDTSIDIYERAGGTTAHVSTGPAGGNAVQDASLAGYSLDGARLFFETVESLVAGDTDTAADVYERYAGATTHISFASAGGNGAIAALLSGASDDGTRAFFDTRESLMTSDTDIVRDVYVAGLGGYPRPKGATPVRASLVPAFRPCTAPNRVHGPPLASASCNPPLLASNHLTVGAPDSNGEVANSVGFAQYTVKVGVAGAPDDADVLFNFSLTDVRLQGTLADYAGQLQAITTVRITDKLNGPSQDEPATVGDVELPVTVPCATTGSTTVGSTCSLTTSFDAITPGQVVEAKRSIWQLGNVRVNDGGADGVVATTPNTLFATQGVLVP
jgi:hypothetical protein